MTHDQVRQLVRRINPIPDPSMLESVDGHVLEMERSMDMQVDEQPTAEVQRRDRWRGPLIGIAAAAVILLGGLVFFNTSEDDVATPAPYATQLTGEMDGQPLEPGAYYIDSDGDETTSTRGTFVLESAGWTLVGPGPYKGVEDSEPYLSMLIVEVDTVWTQPCALGGGIEDAGTTPKALGDQLAEAGLNTVEALAPVEAFGHEGYHMVSSVPAGCTNETNIVWDGPTFGRYYQAEGQSVEWWFLDVEGTTVMVEATWFPNSRKAEIAELRDVLETLVLTPS